MSINQLWEMLEGTPLSGGWFTPENVVLSLLLAFVLGQVIAWVYYFTHSGLSYSKTYVQSLVLVTVVVAMVMAVIGDNIIRAFGLMGALALVRFRNVVKDTRDIVFIFSSLVIGMAAGSQRYAIAVMGTVILSLIAIYLYLTGFGTHLPHNGFLRFSLPAHIGPKHPVSDILKRFCGNFTLISAQDRGFGGAGVEYAYQLMVRNADKNEQLLSELEKIEGIGNISLTMQEQLLEI
ncbi:MAG: DUF4956 domain-containing protein [Sedimentisphaerales bacterium]|nr:DUF4956 domain-containing protein [Sedimentisphaerales bacterium]